MDAQRKRRCALYASIPHMGQAQVSELRKHCTRQFIKCPFLQPHTSSMKNHVVQLPQCSVMKKHTHTQSRDRDVMYTASAGFSQGLKPLFKMLSKYTTKETEKPGRVVVHDRGCALYVQHTHGSQTDAPAFCQNYQNVHKRARHTEGYAHPDHSLHHRVAIHRACGHEANFYLRTFFFVKCVMYRTRHS